MINLNSMLYTSVSLLNLATSAALSMHNFNNSYYLFFISLILVVSSMAFWFRDIISEATLLGDHTLAVQKGLNLGVILFIVSEALFFLAIFWAFFHSSLTPTVELGSQWPPLGIDPINPFELPLLNTVILLSSGATITYAHHSLIHGERKGALYGSIFTILLAIIFTGFQFTAAGFTFFCLNLIHCIVTMLPLSCYNIFTHGYLSYNYVRKYYTLNSLNMSVQCYAAKLGKRFYSTSASKIEDSTLPPYWVTGFTDGEGTFSLKVSKSSSTRSGYNVVPEFKIELHNREIMLLRRIHAFFGVGIIHEYKDKNKAHYSVQSAKDIVNYIIPHFDKYPLFTQKKADYLLFKEAIKLLLTGKARSNIEGIYEILNIKGSMNRGLSDKLKFNFPNVNYVPRLVLNIHEIKDFNWFAGFVDGEGYFYVKSLINKNYSSGYSISLVFSVTQHARDEVLLTKFIDLLGCGKIEKASTRPDDINYRVNKFSDIRDKIIPFFNKYPLHFSKASDIIADKGHLTPEGIKKINSLKSGMNRSRIID